MKACPIMSRLGLLYSRLLLPPNVVELITNELASLDVERKKRRMYRIKRITGPILLSMSRNERPHRGSACVCKRDLRIMAR